MSEIIFFLWCSIQACIQRDNDYCLHRAGLKPYLQGLVFNPRRRVLLFLWQEFQSWFGHTKRCSAMFVHWLQICSYQKFFFENQVYNTILNHYFYVHHFHSSNLGTNHLPAFSKRVTTGTCPVQAAVENKLNIFELWIKFIYTVFFSELICIYLYTQFYLSEEECFQEYLFD